MKTRVQVFAAAVILTLGIFVGWYVRPSCPVIEPGRSDTVTVYDTIRVKQPTPVSEEVVRSVTVRVKQANDTVVATKTPPADSIPPVADSVDVEIPVERQGYETEDYRAVVEGFHASLTSLDIYRRTQIVTQTTPIRVPDTKRWGFGIQAGYGGTIQQGRLVGYPYIGVGVSYDIFRW